jgi:hypothetical protein
MPRLIPSSLWGKQGGLTPPTAAEFVHRPGYKCIILRRAAFSNKVTLFYKDGSSDYLAHPDARLKLTSLGVKDPDKILDFVWNFNKSTIYVKEP